MLVLQQLISRLVLMLIKLGATASSGEVTITQTTAGGQGNTTITLTDAGTAGMSKSDFSGGITIPYLIRYQERKY